MNIAWRYLDKRSATIKAITDYPHMMHILESTPEELVRLEESKLSANGSYLDGMPKTHDPKAWESRLINTLNRIDVNRERYLQAKQFFAWFNPSWDVLNNKERELLSTFYWSLDGDIGRAVDGLCEERGITRYTAEREKNMALSKLATMLFGK